ncbi:hypothetical protein NBRC111894_1340 [Sporolactobacillus inulinus]|uniref:Uncharacterized protein n=1 Tax=Sporolactobacillus inulinus TaxID=2078 RepID=A0A4Y1Z9U2_9BACL|nr:hypothetical protein NBRC111894_1340 [Sporolactobacillus inulinus]
MFGIALQQTQNGWDICTLQDELLLLLRELLYFFSSPKCWLMMCA